MRIENCFDSHVHWLKTGEIDSYVPLQSLTEPNDLSSLSIQSHHYCQDWLLGFGWDQNHWDSQLWDLQEGFPTRHLLDQYFPDHPVHFIRADVHASWVNSKALEVIGLLGKTPQEFPDPEGGVIVRDERGSPTGVLLDAARDLVFAAEPQRDEAYQLRCLKRAMRGFNQRGFTHIRDMTCNIHQWQLARQLEQEGELTLGVEEFFFQPSAEDYATAMSEALAARKDQSELLRVQGVKLFVDGALGSEGAYLSRPYPSGSGQGLLIIERELLCEIFRKCWECDLIPAVHAIGDQAVHEVVMAAWSLKEGKGIEGPLHIEHAQVVRPETLQIMKQIDVTCFLQPCHWLSDQSWLKEKLGGLVNHCFPWRQMEKHQIPFFFGSDSPVESASLDLNCRALVEAEAWGVPAPEKSWTFYHSHPDSHWLPKSYCEFDGKTVKEVFFCGRKIV